MTSHELAKKLLQAPDMPVHFSYEYGDHWRTQVAPEITEIGQGAVSYSSYHNMDRVIEEDAEDDEDDLDVKEDKCTQVILLS